MALTFVYIGNLIPMENQESHTTLIREGIKKPKEKAIDLLYFQGYSLVQAAEKLGISIETLKLQIRKELAASAQQ